jgi:hypothetical protein
MDAILTQADQDRYYSLKRNLKKVQVRISRIAQRKAEISSIKKRICEIRGGHFDLSGLSWHAS